MKKTLLAGLILVAVCALVLADDKGGPAPAQGGRNEAPTRTSAFLGVIESRTTGSLLGIDSKDLANPGARVRCSARDYLPPENWIFSKFKGETELHIEHRVSGQLLTVLKAVDLGAIAAQSPQKKDAATANPIKEPVLVQWGDPETWKQSSPTQSFRLEQEWKIVILDNGFNLIEDGPLALTAEADGAVSLAKLDDPPRPAQQWLIRKIQ